MRNLIILFLLVSAGCASEQMPGYISRTDNSYERTIYGNFKLVVSAMDMVLKDHGWDIVSEVDPSIYERDERYDNNGYQNLLIMTGVRKHFRVVSSTSVHLNVFIHSLGNVCYVEVRYEAQTPLIKQFTSVRNDKVVQDILDKVGQEVER